MSKTNDTSRSATLDDHRPLADSELNAVSGGYWNAVGFYCVTPTANTHSQTQALIGQTIGDYAAVFRGY
jgi:hypothetical protein